MLGDGSAPEMMKVACAIGIEAAKKDGVDIHFEETPMGWCVYDKYKTTLPEESFKKAVELGTVFFGGVGDPKLDNTIGKEHPEMKPEAKCLLALRKKMGLLINIRPMIYIKELDYLTNVRPETIPAAGVKQVWNRFLLEDSYFGNQDLLERFKFLHLGSMGVKLKKDVTGDEEIIADIAYYHKATIEKYVRAGFVFAQAAGLPVISIDKANIMSRYEYWRMIVTRIGKEFPDVPLKHQLVDSANALLFTPEALHGVILCGNEHGDILSDGAAGALGSMGMMCSSSVNPDTRDAMFESGAGTAPTLAGMNKANPIGRILTAGMMLTHIGAIEGGKAIEEAVTKTLKAGYRTLDMCKVGDNQSRVLGTSEMGEKILSYM